MRPAAALVLSTLVLACSDTGTRSAVKDTLPAATTDPVQGFKQSDTMHIYVHIVKPGKSAEYERWVGEVWMPAVEKAGQKYSEVRETTKGQRMFAQTEKAKDGSSRYVWLFEPVPVASPVTDTWVFPDSFLVAGGFSPEEAKAQSKALDALIISATGGEAVRKF